MVNTLVRASSVSVMYGHGQAKRQLNISTASRRLQARQGGTRP